MPKWKDRVDDKDPKKSNYEKILERAMIAGRALTPDILAKIMDALELEKQNPGSGYQPFVAACKEVIDDQKMIDRMWKAAKDALSDPGNVGYCW